MAPWIRALGLALCITLGASSARAEDPAALLHRADWTAEIARAGLSVRVTVDDGKAPVGALLRSSGGALRIDVETPENRAGEVLLYASGRWWFSKPGLRRPAPVSAGQVLGARAATADLVLLLEGVSEDYKPVSQSDDTVDGQPGEPLNILFDPDVQRAALARQRATTESGPQTGNVVGLNNDDLVGPKGLEPLTSTV